jgi:hypothetical protein
MACQQTEGKGSDRKWLKCLVIFVFVADTANAVFDLVYVYDCLVINFSELL